VTRRPTVLLTLPIPAPAMEKIAAAAELRIVGHHPSPSELAGLLSDVDVVVPQLRDALTGDVLAAAGPDLRAACLYSAGYNNVDLPAATRRGCVVTNTPDVLTDATAELTLALILAVSRRVVEGDSEVRSGRFDGWRPDYLLGRGLHNQILGIAGFGRIGQAVARRALAFGMRVLCTRRTRSPLPPDLADRVTVVEWPELLERSDVLSVHAPLTEETHHLVDAAALSRMKPTAVLINTARGPVVDEPALVRALASGEIAGAGLDVYEDEPRLAPGLTDLPNTVLLPHLGSATEETRTAMAEVCASNVLQALAGRLPDQAINPTAWQDRRPPLIA
jgi:glyoxylate reductase